MAEARLSAHVTVLKGLPLRSRRCALRCAAPVRAAPPPEEAITPALIAAATKEGQVTWYTSADLQLAEKVGKAFEQKFPGIRRVSSAPAASASLRAWRRNMPLASTLPTR